MNANKLILQERKKSTVPQYKEESVVLTTLGKKRQEIEQESDAFLKPKIDYTKTLIAGKV